MTRTITTAAELDALPVGSVVRTAEGWLAERWDTRLPQCWNVNERWRVGSYPPVRLIEHAPLTVLHDPSVVPEAAPREATDAALAFVSDVQNVINDDAGDDPDPSWVYERLIESLAVIDNLTAALPLLTAAPSATRDEVARLIDPSGWRYFDTGMFPPDHPASTGVVHNSRETADALLARFNIHAKETDR